jgi:VWFA-related protein
MDLAAQSNVTISALDARGLYTNGLTASEHGPALAGPSLLQNSDYKNSALRLAEDGMAELADGTGGRFFHNSNDLDAGLKDLAETPETVYVLELSLEGIKPDGGYHRLKVKVNSEGVELQARRGYFAPKAEKGKK